MVMMGKRIAFLYAVGISVVGLATATEEEKQCNNPRVPPDCSMVMAPSSIPNAGWGVFSLTDRSRGEEVLRGDVVIQVGDLNVTYGAHAKRLTMDYLWNAAETGGQYEGKVVLSVVPGIGMLANGSPQSFNVLPKLEPKVDEAEVTRHQNSGAGSFSHYHNFSFFFQRDVQAGDEIMVNYGPNWFQQRQNEVNDASAQGEQKLQRSPESLREEGYCLDNIHTGQSTIPAAGRGALATRALAEGSIVAPVPVLPITKREALDMTRVRRISPTESVPLETKQLLLNYCFGHPKSSVLLYSYSSQVNNINHSQKRANVKLQWSSANKEHETLTLEDLEKINTDKTSSAGKLLLELVATREIAEGEEILLDYGSSWQDAWTHHEEHWGPYEKSYAPAYVMDEAVPTLATQKELKDAEKDTYPPNLVTSCFVPYVHPREKPERDVTTSEWVPTPGVFELRNLRPCTVMQRFEVEQEEGSTEEPTHYYTVIIRNRYGLPTPERIPPGHMHVVKGVPRHAIRFTDKLYTTDQHLPGAFRQEIGLEDIFPDQWKDL